MRQMWTDQDATLLHAAPCVNSSAMDFNHDAGVDYVRAVNRLLARLGLVAVAMVSTVALIG